MAQVKDAHEKPPTRTTFGRSLDKKSGPFANLDSVSSPQKLEESLKQAMDAAGAVESAPNRPTAMRAFYSKLKDTKKFVESQIDGIYESIKTLEDIEKSSAGKNVKQDAREMREALKKLVAEWENKEGLAQQIVKFAEIGALYPEEAQAALSTVRAAAV